MIIVKYCHFHSDCVSLPARYPRTVLSLEQGLAVLFSMLCTVVDGVIVVHAGSTPSVQFQVVLIMLCVTASVTASRKCHI